MEDEYEDYLYSSLDSDETLLHSIFPHLVTLRESIISSISISNNRKLQATNTHDIPTRHMMVSHEQHKQVTSTNPAELWCIGIKRAQATIVATS